MFVFLCLVFSCNYATSLHNLFTDQLGAKRLQEMEARLRELEERSRELESRIQDAKVVKIDWDDQHKLNAEGEVARTLSTSNFSCSKRTNKHDLFNYDWKLGLSKTVPGLGILEIS